MKPKTTVDEINTGFRAILTIPFLYTLFGQLMGFSKQYRLYINQFIKPFPGMRILDIGCGTSAILNFLPLHIDYTGYDLNSEYIGYAKKHYGHRASFFNQRVTEMTALNSKPFDIVIAHGLVHHLNDTEATKLFQIGRMNLKDNAFMLTIDPVLIEKQNTISRLIAMIDRGQHIRYPHEYKKLAKSNFQKIEPHIVHNLGNFRLTGCFLKCYKI